MSIKINLCPASIAGHRLSHKEAEVKKQLDETIEFIESVKVANSILPSSYECQCKRIQRQFVELHDALNQKERELCHQLHEELQVLTSLKEKLISNGETVIESTKVVLQEASDIHKKEKDVEFVKRCSCVSQTLEERFTDLLLLFSDHNVGINTSLERELCISTVFLAIESLNFIDDQGIKQTEMEPLKAHTQDAAFIATSSTSAVESHLPDDANLLRGHDLVAPEPGQELSSQSFSTEMATVIDQALISVSNAAQKATLEWITLINEIELEAIITGVKDPTEICIQPYGNELVDLMERMGKFYEDLASGGGCSVVSIPQVGDICCAQFTQDDCWYRAVVTAVDQIHVKQGELPVSASSVCVNVKYIDYGNEEQLPLYRLQPLDTSFLSLPRQALSCHVSGIKPVPNGEHPGHASWSSQLNQWLEKLLIGKKVRIVVVSKESPEHYGIDVHVPCEWLQSGEPENLLPIHNPSIIDMKVILKPDSSVQLSTLLCSTGLAIPEKSGICLPSCILPTPPSCPQKDVSVPLVTDTLSPSLVINNHMETNLNENCQNTVEEPPCIVSHLTDTAKAGHQLLPTTKYLAPLSIALGPKSDFSFLVSHIVNHEEFYVHPIQDSVVQSMSVIPESLSKHYSVSSNKRNITFIDLTNSLLDSSNGVLCCVLCPEDKQWYRGVISSPPQENEKCLVHLLDYGERIVVSFDNVFELANEYCGFPAQVICCSLDLFEPSENLKGKSPESFAQSVGSLVCTFLRDNATSKQLVACVELNEANESSKLVIKYGSVISVNVMDTSGEKDANIVQLLQKGSFNVYESKRNSDGKVNEWNPMERDYLAQRNNYGIDNEATGLALHGYESTNRPCRFYKSEAGCFQGEECPYLHLQEGVYDKQLEQVHTAPELVELPAVKSVVLVVVTAIVSATRFYVQMPLGKKSLLQKSLIKQDESVVISKVFFKLLKEMRAYYDHHVFSDRSVVSAEVGEIVAVRFDGDDWWYRARVVRTSHSGKTKVFYVDYGHYGLVCWEDVRSIKPEFLTVPFQAIECYLPRLCIPDSATDLDKAKAKQYFKSLVSGHVLVANVVAISGRVILGLELYSNVHINKKLIEDGFLQIRDEIEFQNPELSCKEQLVLTPG